MVLTFLLTVGEPAEEPLTEIVVAVTEALRPTVKVRMEVVPPEVGVTDAGEKEAVTLAGKPVAERFTDCAAPSVLVSVMVTVPCWPWVMPVINGASIV